MKSCPQCGKSENEISMETGRENVNENRAWCPCGWEGTYADMKDDKPAKKAKAVEDSTDEAAK